nr:hypothetical protein [Tanacetum cinerariifolium]
MLPIELTNDEIRNTNAYKEYYTFATREAAPKPKASARRKRSGSDTFITPPTATTTPKTIVAVTPKLTATAKGNQPAKAKSLFDPSEVQIKELVRNQGFLRYPLMNQKNSHGTLLMMKVLMIKKRSVMMMKEMRVMIVKKEKKMMMSKTKMVMKEMMMKKIKRLQKYDEQDDAEGGRNDEEEGGSYEEDDNEETREEESFDPIPKTSEGSEDEGDGEEDQGLNVNEEEHVEEEEEDELYRDVNINQGKGLQATLEVEDTHVTLTPINSDGQQKSSSVSSQFVTSMLNPTSDV